MSALELRPVHNLDTAPPAVRALAVEHGLGSTFRTYEAATGRRRAEGALGALVFVACFTVALAFLLIAGGGVAGLIPLVLLFALILLFAAISKVGEVAKAVMSIGAIVAPGSRVYLFDSGLVHSGLTRSGKHGARAFHWSDVSVFRDFHPDNSTSTSEPVPAHYTYTAKRPDGAAVELNHSHWEIVDIHELGGAIVDGVSAAQVPQVLAAVRGGRAVRFGRFTVSDRGLRYARSDQLVRSKMVRWDHIEHVYGSGDDITVRTTRRLFNQAEYPAWIVPNAFVLVAVAETLIREARRW